MSTILQMLLECWGFLKSHQERMALLEVMRIIKSRRKTRFQNSARCRGCVQLI